MCFLKKQKLLQNTEETAMSLRQLPTDILKLLLFQHKGLNLNWDENSTRLLTIANIFLFFVLFAIKQGEHNLLALAKAHWLITLNLVGITGFLFMHYANTMILRVEVGILLICIAFTLIHIVIMDMASTTPQELINLLYLWQILAIYWYYGVSRIQHQRVASTPRKLPHEVPYNMLKHGVASTYGNGFYLLIDEKEGRHPIASFIIKDNAIMWENASGEKESIGHDFPLSDEVIRQAKTDELRILEKNKRNKVVRGFSVDPIKHSIASN